METKKITKTYIILKYGLYIGVILIFVSLLFYILEMNIFDTGVAILNGLISIVIPIIFTVIGIKTYRDKIKNGQATFGQKFLVGFLILLIGSLISGVFTYLFFNYYEPEYFPSLVESFIEKMEDKGFNENLLDKITEKMEKAISPKKTLSDIAISPIVAAIISLIISAFIKNKEVLFSVEEEIEE